MIGFDSSPWGERGLILKGHSSLICYCSAVYSTSISLAYPDFQWCFGLKCAFVLIVCDLNKSENWTNLIFFSTDHKIVKVQYTCRNYSLSKTFVFVEHQWPLNQPPWRSQLNDVVWGCLCLSEWVHEQMNESELCWVYFEWTSKLRCFQVISCWPTDCILTKVHLTCCSNYDGRVGGTPVVVILLQVHLLGLMFLVDRCVYNLYMCVCVHANEDPRVCVLS